MRKTRNTVIYALIATALIAGMLYLNRVTAPKDLVEFNKQEAKLVATTKAEPIKAVATSVEAVVEKPKAISVKCIDESFISVTKQDLVIDIMSNYHNVPTRAKREIIDTLIEESQKYAINPMITYSAGHTESSMNPYVIHKDMIITIGDKKVKINAMGLNGIVYEWWGEKLIAAGIITNRADLLDPILNIKSFCFIYNELRKMPMHQSATNKDQSALLRYFGGDYKSYLDRIDTKIGDLIASKLYKGK